MDHARCTMWMAAVALSATCGVDVVTAQTARPKYGFLRYQEDWSVLRETPDEADPWDSIKYIPLSDDEEIWLSLGGSTRVRSETWENFSFLDSSAGDDTFVLWRALLHADLHIGENVRVFAEGKTALSTDRDLPGGRRGLDVDSLDLQQGFVDWRMPMDDATLTLRAGRQAFLFGKQRLVSPLPWSNTLRSWDGISAILEVDAWTVHGFWSQFAPVVKHEFNDPDAQRQLYGVYASEKLDTTYVTGLDLYFLGLSNRNTITVNGTTGSEDRYTLGGRISGKISDTAFDYDLEAAYQFGRVGSGDIAAYMLGAQLGHTFGDSAWKPRVYVGVEMGSGDDGSGGDVETFNQLFPLGHAYFGQIDAIGRQNAIDLSLGTTFKPMDQLSVAVSGHFFWRESDEDALYNVGGGVARAGALGGSSEIGQEIDVKATYRFDRHTTFELGYSHFFAGDFIEESGPSEDIDFVYAQVRYAF